MALVCSSVALLVAIACPDKPQEAATAPVPAFTYSSPVSSIGSTSAKHAAIIGAPSSLQQILMQQAGAAPAAPVVAQHVSVTPAAGGALIQARPAIMERSLAVRPTYGWTPASPDRPDIFGSTALPIARTQLDAKWRRATAGFSGAVAISRQIAEARQVDSAMAQVQLVNGWVNRRIQFVNDIRSSGQSDLWSGAAETIARGHGDCEDYAITKLQLLKALGFADEDLYLSVVKDVVRRADHAILVVRVDGRFLVLDNNVDRVLEAHEVSDYRPLITYAASGKAWTHGYRQSVQFASVDPAAAPATAN